METESTRLAAALRDAGADLALLTSFEDVCYATGFEVPPPIDAGAAFAYGPTVALCRADGHTTLLAPNAYAARAEELSGADETILVPTFGHFEPVDSQLEFLSALRGAVSRSGAQVVAVDRATLPAAAQEALGDVRTVDAAPVTRAARLVKTPRELELIRRAVAAADVGQEALLELAVPGANELDLMGEVLTRVERHAGQPVPWAGELVTGPRTSVVRYPGGPVDRTLEAGDTALMDLSVRLDGYWADCCNVLVVGGEPHAEQVRHFQAAHGAFEAAVAALHPGARASDVHAAAAAAFQAAGLPTAHYTGHQLGTSVNEDPRLVPYDHTEVEAGMVFAVEPGAYAGAGGTTGARTEKVVLVTDGGPEVLSRFRWGIGG